MIERFLGPTNPGSPGNDWETPRWSETVRLSFRAQRRIPHEVSRERISKPPARGRRKMVIAPTRFTFPARGASLWAAEEIQDAFRLRWRFPGLPRGSGRFNLGYARKNQRLR